MPTGLSMETKLFLALLRQRIREADERAVRSGLNDDYKRGSCHAYANVLDIMKELEAFAAK